MYLDKLITPLWRTKQLINNMEHTDIIGFQWYYCKLRRCGYEHTMCPKSVAEINVCSYRLMGIKREGIVSRFM